ncbi:MAG: GntR family transcriptional regulator [Halanaerobiales bacterium]
MESLPGYKKIAGEITGRIHSGEYPSRSFLPSENQLAREFGVTRSTIRKALNILKQRGTIESFQGKGYRVRSLIWEQSLLHFYSFGRNIARKFYNPETRLLSATRIEGENKIEKFGREKLWEITRLRLVDGLPLILETSYIPVKYLEKAMVDDFHQDSLYNLLEDRGVHLVKADEYLEPVIPSARARKYLEINKDQPLFQTVRYTYDSRQHLVEMRESLIRGDHFRFSVEMTL